MTKINIFFGSGASRTVWQMGVAKTLSDKKLKTNEYEIENVYAVSGGNWMSFGFIFNEIDLLHQSWLEINEEENNLYTLKKNRKFYEPLFDWDDSAIKKLINERFGVMDKNKRVCNFYTAVFNLSKLKSEWISAHDKDIEEMKHIFFTSSSMPFLFPTMKINNDICLDAGLFEYFLIYDFINKHRDENNIILTTDFYFLKVPPKTIHLNMPQEIKKNINFMDSNPERIKKVIDLGEEHGLELISKIEKIIKKKEN